MTLEELKSTDGEPFRQLFAIYAASITPGEQKPEAWIRAMVADPRYRVWIARDDDRLLGLSILFVPPAPPEQAFALLEYMAVAPERRGQGFGAKLFAKSVSHAVTPQGARLPVVLEVDSDGEAASDRALRTRRLAFYRRLGCATIGGLRYQMPLRGGGPVPEMVLMVHQSPPPAPPHAVARDHLQSWLQTIYRDVYRESPDDPRIAQMLAPLPDPVPLE